MSLEKVAELAKEFQIKLAEQQYATKAPADKKASDFSSEEESFINSISKKDNNQAKDELELDEKTWKRAKKAVKKYWKKYDEPWAVVYDVYRKMGGKAAKKSKKKKSFQEIELMLQKYALYGEIPNVTPPQNQIELDAKQVAAQAVYNLLSSLHSEKAQGHFGKNSDLEDSYNKITEFYHSLLAEGKRAKFELYDQAVSDPSGFSILEEDKNQSVRDGLKPTKLDRMLTTSNAVLRKHLNEANAAVRELKQETYS
jgi:hypothetical protein